MKITRSNKVYGIGINDVPNSSKGELVEYKNRWSKMLKRCYDPYYLNEHSTYRDVVVCDDWHRLSVFMDWMKSKEWKGLDLDKDMVVGGSKVYSPDTCAFIPHFVNVFSKDIKKYLGDYPLGVHVNGGRFRAKVNNPLIKKEEHLGYFDCPHEAHLIWKKRKHEIACEIADGGYVNDDRVNERLRLLYK